MTDVPFFSLADEQLEHVRCECGELPLSTVYPVQGGTWEVYCASCGACIALDAVFTVMHDINSWSVDERPL